MARKTKLELEEELERTKIFLAGFYVRSKRLVDSIDHPENVFVVSDGSRMRHWQGELQDSIAAYETAYE